MRNSIKTILLTALLLVNGGLIYSQQSRIELGDKYYDLQAFEKAIPLYENANKTGKIHAKLGDCYYYTSQPEKARIEYDLAFKKVNSPNFFEKVSLKICFMFTKRRTGHKKSKRTIYKLL